MEEIGNFMIIETKCGEKIKKPIKPLNKLQKQNMKDAMVGCGTLHPITKKYIEIKNVWFA